MTKYTLLTGATGLVGRYLMRDMLLNGHHLALIVRSSRREAAARRVEGICQFWEREIGTPMPRPVVIEGNISEPDLAISAENKQWVAEHCDKIIHNAAILEFFGKDREREPWKTNLYGTEKVLKFCKETNIRDMHYVSTAYVAGMQDGVVMEDSLEAGQAFRNDYEESKYEAEMMVRAADWFDKTTVYRPAVIAGDSNTGYTSTYHGLYLYFRLMALLIPEIEPDENGIRQTPVKLDMTGNERRNIVPVEWISECIARLFDTPEAHGMTFHLAPEKPMTSGEVIKWSAEYFGTAGVEFHGDDPNFEVDEQEADFAAMLIPQLTTYKAYEKTDNLYDLSNLKRFLPDLPSPVIDKTILSRYLDFGEADKWGKAKQPETVVEFDVRERLAEVASNVVSSDGVVGLDISGPGGGQFTLSLHGSRVASVAPGLPVEDAPILRMQVDEFSSFFTDPQADTSNLQQRWQGEANARVTEQATQALFPMSLANAD